MSPRSVHSNAEAPVIDFDLIHPLAGLHMMELMCCPDNAKRTARLAKMGIYLLGEQEPFYLNFVKRALDASAHGRPPDGTLEKLTAEISSDLAVGTFLCHWAKLPSSDYAAFVTSVSQSQPLYLSGCVPGLEWNVTNANADYTLSAPNSGRGVLVAGVVDWEERHFWAWMSKPHIRERLTRDPRSVVDPFYDRLIVESGGWAAAAKGPEIDAIEAEFKNSLLGYPMLSGLALILIQIFKDHHSALDENGNPQIVPSLTSACRTIAGLEIIKGKFNEVKRHWPSQCFIAPLWAAFLIEADCLTGEFLLDVTALENAYMSVIRSRERRVKLLSLAKPFCELVRTHEVQGHPLTPYPERVLRLHDSISPEPVTLPKLTGDALEKALPPRKGGLPPRKGKALS